MKRYLSISDGVGLDSMGMLAGLEARGKRPDTILFADTGGEKDETYDYLHDVMDPWLRKVGFPPVTVVVYRVQDFKNWPPYYTLEENCLTNGTLPSEAFGFGSCSMKWKQAPQHTYLQGVPEVRKLWAEGGQVTKAIGYDCDPKEKKRTFRVGVENDLYAYWYPLQEWGWTRAECAAQLRRRRIPVPVKSSCWFCPNMTPTEIKDLDRSKLARIVIMEARALPRLLAYAEEKGWPRGKGIPIVEGLWRQGTKGARGAERKPGKMTQFILEQRLLPEAVVLHLQESVPSELRARNDAAAAGKPVESWRAFLKRVLGEAGIRLGRYPA